MLAGEIPPDVAARLGMRAAFHRTVVAGLEGGAWVEVDLTAPAFDVFDYNEVLLPFRARFEPHSCPAMATADLENARRRVSDT